MSDENLICEAAALWSIVAVCAAKKKLQKKRRTVWCKKWLSRGSYTQYSELRTENRADFEKNCRMPIVVFHELLKKVEPLIAKKDTILRESIPPCARLEATLRFLAAGESYTNLQHSTKISKQSLGKIIPETCAAIYEVLREQYLKMPTSPEEWKAVAKKFEKWHFPHCVGAVGGKHVTIRPPKESGSCYFNYLGSHSIVFMAVVDANYEFMYVDIGRNGRTSGGGVWANSTLCARLQAGDLGLPPDEQLSDSQRIMPYVFVGDDAFPLTRHLMKPYPLKNQSNEERIFSCRLSRARRVVENAFGILANKFRVLLSPINLSPEKAEKIVLACTALHNFLRREHESSYTPAGSLDDENIVDGTVTAAKWRTSNTQLLPLERMGRNCPYDAKRVRTEFMNYFSEEGAVPWQNLMCDIY